MLSFKMRGHRDAEGFIEHNFDKNGFYKAYHCDALGIRKSVHYDGLWRWNPAVQRVEVRSDARDEFGELDDWRELEFATRGFKQKLERIAFDIP